MREQTAMWSAALAATLLSLAGAGLSGCAGASQALGLVMGGAVGNLIDRVRLGAVVDFLDFSGAHFPWVFNVADSGISIGVAVLLLDSLLAPRPATA